MDDLIPHLRNNNLVKQGSMSEIKVSLCIDSEFWIKQYLGAEPEPMSKLLGGSPLSMKYLTITFIEKLLKFNIKPIFVFSGINIDINPHTDIRNKVELRSGIWKNYSLNNPIFIDNLSKGQLIPWEIYGEFIRIIRNCGGEVVRAPYAIGSQLLYFYDELLTGGVYGNAELLAYGKESSDFKLIVKLDLDQGTYEYVSRQELARELKITKSMLVDYYALNGFWFRRPLVSGGLDLLTKLEQTQALDCISKPDEKEHFSKVKQILLSDITINLKKKGLCTGDVSGIVQCLGSRLPRELYFAMCFFPLSSQMFSTICSGRLVELPPFADSNYYRRALKGLESMRDQIFSMIFKSLDANYIGLTIDIQYWFKATRRISLTSDLPKLNWVFTEEKLEEELVKSKTNRVCLQFCLLWHFDAYRNKELLHSDEVTTSPATAENMISVKVLFKFLECRHYISSGKPTHFSKEFIKFPTEFQEPCFFLLELMTLGLISKETLSQSECAFLDEELFNRLTVVTPPKIKSSILIISRVISLLHPELEGSHWEGPLDYDLIQFHFIVRLITTSCQSLLEAILLSEFLTGSITYSTNITRSVDNLPFSSHSHIGLGIAVKFLLTGKTLQEVKGMFPSLSNLDSDLARSWRFWVATVKMLKSLTLKKCLPEGFFKDFLTAGSLFQGVLRRSGIKLS